MTSPARKRTSPAPPVGQSSGLFDQLDAEMWLAKRLREHRIEIFDGETNAELRRERFRAAILEHGLSMTIIGRRAGKPETYESCFERICGEPLNPKGKSKHQSQEVNP